MRRKGAPGNYGKSSGRSANKPEEMLRGQIDFVTGFRESTVRGDNYDTRFFKDLDSPCPRCGRTRFGECRARGRWCIHCGIIREGVS